MTDEKLLLLIQKRDQEALVRLQERYEAYCRKIAWSLLRDEQIVSECLNDVWLSLWSSPELPHDLKPWLTKVTRNAALHHIRSSEAQKRSGCTVLLDELAECIPDPLRQQEAETQWLKELLENFLRTLKKEERYVFLRRYWYGYTIGELAAELCWREAKVNSLLYRLRQRLKECLQKEGYRL